MEEAQPFKEYDKVIHAYIKKRKLPSFILKELDRKRKRFNFPRRHYGHDHISYHTMSISEKERLVIMERVKERYPGVSASGFA